MDHLRVKRGMVLGAEPAPAVTMAEGEFHVLDSIQGTMDDYPEVHLHLGTASILAHVAMLESTEMRAGQGQMVQLRLEEPLPVAVGERFVLRANLPGQEQAGLVTIGGGRIAGTSDIRLRRQKPWIIERLRARCAVLDDPALWCAQMLREAGKKLALSELRALCPQLKAEELALILEDLRTRGIVRSSLTGAMVHRELIDKAASGLLQAMEDFHKANPQRAGVERAEMFGGLEAEIGELAIRQLLDSKAIEPSGTGFARTGWSARMPERDQKVYDQVRAAFQAAGWAGPGVAELATGLRETPERVERAIKLLCERGILVRLDAQLCIHQSALESAQKIVLQLFAKKPIFTTMEFRDALGVSRKYAVPLLDYLDKVRFTVRNGNNRMPGVEARKLL
jgi:selenocysteine-specific elongation factor